MFVEYFTDNASLKPHVGGYTRAWELPIEEATTYQPETFAVQVTDCVWMVPNT